MQASRTVCYKSNPGSDSNFISKPGRVNPSQESVGDLRVSHIVNAQTLTFRRKQSQTRTVERHLPSGEELSGVANQGGGAGVGHIYCPQPATGKVSNAIAGKYANVLRANIDSQLSEDTGCAFAGDVDNRENVGTAGKCVQLCPLAG